MTTTLSISGKSPEEYVTTMEAAVATALRLGVMDLREPRVTCPRAQRMLDQLAEMLAGFTLGTIVRNVCGGLQRWFGESFAQELKRSLPRVLHLEMLDVEVSYLDDADARPMVEALASRLHVRYCGIPRAVEALLVEVETLVRLMAPQKHRYMTLMLGALCRDAEELQRGLTDEIYFGWSMFAAATRERPLPSTDGRMPRSIAMWSTWHCTVLPQPPAPRDEAQEAGYILLVA